jgi:adenylate cyclase
MPVEIERKFLVASDEWRGAVTRSEWRRQSYLARTAGNSVRVRRNEAHGTITVKGPRVGLARDEFEYRIPVLDAEHMLQNLCVTPIIEKVRHWVEFGGMLWEVDVYNGEAAGLVLAEIELMRPDQPFALPCWVSAEVTDDARYRSEGLALGLWRAAALDRPAYGPPAGDGAPSRRRRSRSAPRPQA